MNKLELYGLFLAVVIGAFFSGRYVEWNNIRIEQKAADQQHKQELKDAGDKHAQEIHDILNAKPLPTVRLCHDVQSGKAPSSVVSPSPDMAPTMHDGNNPIRTGDDSPDIGNLFSAYATVFAIENANLIEQQAVK